MTAPPLRHLDRLIDACDRLGLAEALSYLKRPPNTEVEEPYWIWRFPFCDPPVVNGRGKPANNPSSTKLLEDSDSIVAKYGLKRSTASEAAYGDVTLEQQHFDLVDWGARTIRPFLQEVVRPTSIMNRNLVPELHVSTESSRARDKRLRNYAKIAARENDVDASAAILCQIIADPTLRTRLDRSGVRSDVYMVLEWIMDGKPVDHLIKPTLIEGWCRILSKTKDVRGAPEAPAAVHAFAQETWDFYSLLLGLQPTVNSNSESPWTAYQHWSYDVAKLVFHNLASDQWDTALRGRGVGPGSKYLSGDVAHLRYLKLPWTKPMHMPSGGTAGGTNKGAENTEPGCR